MIQDIKTYHPLNKKEWRSWLDLNHQNQDSIWLVMHKKKSAHPNLSWSEAVDEAICYGWIDSVKKTIDAERYKQYYSKRRPKSGWSKINKAKVDYLIKNGLMKEAGFKSIETAKKNGSWTILDSVEALIIPDDLIVQFNKHPKSKNYYSSLSNSRKKMILFWINQAKRTETKQKRISELIIDINKGLVPKIFR